MKKEEFEALLRQQTQDIHVSAQLRARTIWDVYEMEENTMKRTTGKRMMVAVLCVVLCIAACGAALAAAERMGIIDFFGGNSNRHIPQDAQEYIKSGDILMENDVLSVQVREVYYDGIQSMLVVDVTAKAENIMLLGELIQMDEPWANMNLHNPGFDKTDRRTVQQVYEQGGYHAAYCVSLSLTSDEDMYDGWDEFTLNGDGSLSIVHMNNYEADLDVRDMELQIRMLPRMEGEEAVSGGLEKAQYLTQEITLNSAAVQKEVYVSSEKALFSSVGIQVDQLRVEVKPHELYVSLYCTVADEAAYRRMLYDGDEAIGEINLFTEFELIDPESTAAQPWDQRLSSGMTDNGGIRMLDEEGERFIYQFTIGRNELHEEYTLRAFEWGVKKERFEAVTLKMRPAVEADFAIDPKE